MLTNTNFSFCVNNVVNIDGRMEKDTLFRKGRGPNPDDIILTYLPLCHIAERIFSTWTSVSCGCTLNFAESIDTVQQNLREIQPTIFFSVPRIWEKIHATIAIKGRDATFFKRIWFGLGMSMAALIGRQRVAND